MGTAGSPPPFTVQSLTARRCWSQELAQQDVCGGIWGCLAPPVLEQDMEEPRWFPGDTAQGCSVPNTHPLPLPRPKPVAEPAPGVRLAALASPSPSPHVHQGTRPLNAHVPTVTLTLLPWHQLYWDLSGQSCSHPTWHPLHCFFLGLSSPFGLWWVFGLVSDKTHPSRKNPEQDRSILGPIPVPAPCRSQRSLG